MRTLVLSEANLDPSRAGSGSYQIAQLPEEEFAGAALFRCAPCAVHRLPRCALRGGDPP